LPKVFDSAIVLKDYFPNVKASGLVTEYSEINSAMSLSKRDPSKIITGYDLLKATNWTWSESKNTKRDWKPLIRSVIVETKFIERYRPVLLKMPPTRLLRTKLQLLLVAFIHAKPVQQMINGKLVSRMQRVWNYPDNMEWKKLHEFSIDFEEELNLVQQRGRRLQAKKEVAAAVAKIETLALSRVGPEKSHDISPGVQRALNLLITVSVSCHISPTLLIFIIIRN